VELKYSNLSKSRIGVQKMNDLKYNLQFEKLCKILNLGELVLPPKPVSGGFLHRMYAIETTRGKYAIKALDPQIMLRPAAMQRSINGERIATIASNNIPALSAKKINGTFIQEVDKQFYVLFDWVEGRSLKSSEINTIHCERMGDILAEIHEMDFLELGIANETSYDEQVID
jgi:aminoglycoside phosphotransferase (APT) family kinase protein